MSELTLEQLTPEARKQLIEQAKKELQNEKELESQEKQKYDELRGQVVSKLVTNALLCSANLQDFKKLAFEEMTAMYELLKQYSNRGGKKEDKGSFTLVHENMKVEYRRQGKAVFDERSTQAEKMIHEFISEKYEGDQATKDLIMCLLERKNGDLDINLIQKLYAMEDQFDDPNWKNGIRLLKESFSYTSSKDYIRFYLKDENNKWEPILLDFASVKYQTNDVSSN